MSIRRILIGFSLFFLSVSCVPASSDSLDIQEIAMESFRRFHLSEPYPEVYVVEYNHPAVMGDVIGRASKFLDGSEVIYLENTHIRTVSKLEDLLDHEVAHVKSWRINGATYANRFPHGLKYKEICRAYALRPTSCSPSLF
jgi:hypothetical protein